MRCPLYFIQNLLLLPSLLTIDLPKKEAPLPNPAIYSVPPISNSMIREARKEMKFL
jgi:hypothetical protein